MKKLILVLYLVLASTGANEVLPNDVKSFIANAAACEHFAGEFDGELSEKRQREIERAVVRHCGPAQRQLKRLLAKYNDDPKVRELIAQHANESVTSFR
ncbi:hypothetical protein ACLB1G_23700 [Oxalobacteraceae bacterium A2-2]